MALGLTVGGVLGGLLVGAVVLLALGLAVWCDVQAARARGGRR